MIDATIYLTETNGMTFTEVKPGEVDQRLREATKVQLSLAVAPGTDIFGTLERIYALANGMPNPEDGDLTAYYYANRVRSLSVGDLVLIPFPEEGEGLYAVASMGFTKLDLGSDIAAAVSK